MVGSNSPVSSTSSDYSFVTWHLSYVLTSPRKTSSKSFAIQKSLRDEPDDLLRLISFLRIMETPGFSWLSHPRHFSELSCQTSTRCRRIGKLDPLEILKGEVLKYQLEIIQNPMVSWLCYIPLLALVPFIFSTRYIISNLLQYLYTSLVPYIKLLSQSLEGFTASQAWLPF